MWQIPPETPHLKKDEVHVIRFYLNLGDTHIELLERILNEEEIERAGRYHFQIDRQRFIARRGKVRKILGSYLDIKPDKIQFRYTKYGKPVLFDHGKGGTLNFNYSFSKDIALAIVAIEREVGIDIEYIKDSTINLEIAQRYFSHHEIDMFRPLPPESKTQAFYNCWTRKEAFIKAKGMGLSMGLDTFDVSLIPGEPAQLLRVAGDPTEASRWSMFNLAPGSEFAAAAVVEGGDYEVICSDWFERSG